jgi:hypothetical protein
MFARAWRRQHLCGSISNLEQFFGNGHPVSLEVVEWLTL